MTEEEYFRKTYPDFCYGDKPLSPYWDFFQYGVEFGERQSENKIADIKANCDLAIEGRDVKIKELEQQIEKMKSIGRTSYIKGIRTMANALKDYDRTDGAWTDYFEHTVDNVLKKLLKEVEK